MAAPGIDRSRRIAGVVQREISELIVSELGDPRLNGVTVTDVKVTRDLREAVVYVSSLAVASGPEEAAGTEHEFVEVLNRAAGILRRHLGQRMSTRSTPSLKFEYDETLAQSFRLSRIIDESIDTEAVTDGTDPAEMADGATESGKTDA